MAIRPSVAAANLGNLAAELSQVEADASVLAVPAATAECPFQAEGFASAAFVRVAAVDYSQPSKASRVGCSAETWSRAVVEAVASRRAGEAC